MRKIVLSFLIFSEFFNLSCQKQVFSSPVSSNERMVEIPKPTPTPEKFEKIYVIDAMDDNSHSLLEFQDYQIEKVTVKKSDEYDNPKADIFDAVVSKNGKKIARLEGTYYPLGNWMNFGLYPFLGESVQQLWVSDRTGNKDGNDWIVSLSPKFEVIFDSNDYKYWQNSGFVDVEKDGVLELLVAQVNDLDLGLASMNDPWAEVVFKYDPKTHKYQPASHILTEYTLDGIVEKINKYREADSKSFKDLLEIMLIYFYAGKENEAWNFFAENFSPKDNYSGRVSDKKQARKTIKTALDKDPIYKYIKADLKKNK